MSTIQTMRPAIATDVRSLACLLQETIGATAVWLFGSQARGDSRPDSDIDLLAIVNTSSLSRYQRAVQALKATQKVKLPKDLVVLTRDEWEKGLLAPCSLPATVVREGIRIL